MSTLIKSAMDEHEDAQWLSLFALIAASMLALLLVALGLSLDNAPQPVGQRQDASTAVRTALYDALHKEFSGDLQRWNAAIDKQTLTLTFSNHPDELFKAPNNQLTSHFRRALEEFYPRYTAVLQSFGAAVEEVRIESHTSSDWGGLPAARAYFLNLELSQRRVRSVLNFLYAIVDESSGQAWIREKVSAVGLSSAKPVLDQSGSEDPQRSRRITFRVLINVFAGTLPNASENSHGS